MQTACVLHAQVAKIYISVYSDPQGRHVAMRGLSRLEGYVRKHIASSINMRLCPEIRFIQDDSIQRGEEVRLCCYVPFPVSYRPVQERPQSCICHVVVCSRVHCAIYGSSRVGSRGVRWRAPVLCAGNGPAGAHQAAGCRRDCAARDCHLWCFA